MSKKRPIDPNRRSSALDLIKKQRDNTGELVKQKRQKRLNREKAALNRKGSSVTSREVSGLITIWEGLFEEYFPEYKTAWKEKHTVQLKRLLEDYSVGQVRTLFVFMFENWEKATENFSNKPLVPQLGWISSLVDSFLPKALFFDKIRATKLQVEDFRQNNPGKELPDKLAAEWIKCREGMEKLGLV